MPVRQRSKWCRQCQQQTLHQKEVFSGGMGCLLTILTGGLFLIFWILGDLLDIFKSYRCQQCGRAN